MKHKLLLLCLLCATVFYNTAKANETEPNNTRAQANTLTLNGSNSGKISPAGDQDWWKVTTTGDGKLSVTLTPLSGKYTYINIYDNNGTTLLNSNYGNSQFTVSADGLAAGTYYVKIVTYYETDTSSYTISNSLTQPSQANDAEPDDTKAQAKVLSLNGSKTGHVNYYYNGHRDSADWYKVTTTADGKLRLRLTSGNGLYVWAYLYDNDGTTQLNANNTNGTVDINSDGLAAGTYYIRINSYYHYPDNTYSGDGFEPYTLSDSLFTTGVTNDAEPNDSVPITNTLALNGSTTGHVNYYYNHKRDAADWYKVTTTADGRLRLRLTSGNGLYVWAYLYDNDGTTQLSANNTNGTVDINADGLAAGTYYIRINSYYSYGSNTYNGTDFETYTLADSLFKPALANDSEPNDSVAIANTLAVNSSTKGHTNYYYNHKRDAADWYKITLPHDGMLRLRLTSANGLYVWAYLFDHDGTTQLSANNTNGTVDINTDGLAAGTYYVRINSYYSYGSNSYNGTDFEPYTLADSLFTYTYGADVEPNKYAAQAKTLPANNPTTGHVNFYYNNSRDSVDWWKINYTGSGNLSLTVNEEAWKINGSNPYYWVDVYKDTSASAIYHNDFNSNTTINLSSLTEGYYYVRIYPYYGGDFVVYSLTPTFTQIDIAKVKATGYDTSGTCASTNAIAFTASLSHAPYTMQLFRFGMPYGNPVVTAKKHTFNNLPAGLYYATVYGDGATGAAFGKSKTLSIEPVPGGLHTTNIKSNQARLNWDSLECAAYFTIQYKVHGSNTWSKKKTTRNVNLYILSGLTANTKYDWKVAATDSANGSTTTGAYSDSISFTTTSSLIADINNEEDNLSINTGKKTALISVIPNPASSYFVIHYNNSVTEKVNAQLFDMNGKAVWSSGLVSSDALNGKQVDVNQFAKGVFYLKIMNESGALTGSAKIIVAR